MKRIKFFLLLFFIFCLIHLFNENVSASVFSSGMIDINPTGSSQAVRYEGIVYGEYILFDADDGVHGRELWISDGTQEGTVMVKDINPLGDSNPYEYFEYDGKILFRADDGINGTELWVTDGTNSGTYILKNINPSGSSDVRYFINYQNNVYFRANGSSGYELWMTDGTSGGTVLFKDINPSGNSFPIAFIEYHDKLFFCADNGVDGRELWYSDGTPEGTLMLKDINPTGSSEIGGTYTLWGDFYLLNDELIFSANDGVHGAELWKTDGTVEGTQLIKDISSLVFGGRPLWGGEVSGMVYNDELYFQGTDVFDNTELWKTDGTFEGTVLVKDINPTGSSFPDLFINYKNELYFQAETSLMDIEVWKTDGTVEGTMVVTDVGDPDTFCMETLILFNGELYFSGFAGLDNCQMYKTDGTIGETPVIPNTLDYSGYGVVINKNRMYFNNYDELNYIHYDYQIDLLDPDLGVTAEGLDVKLGSLQGIYGDANVLLHNLVDNPIALIGATFLRDLDWTVLQAGIDIEKGKSFLHGFSDLEGVDETYFLFVPYIEGDHYVGICPNVISLEETNDNCQGVYYLSTEDPNVVLEDINGQLYWIVSGLSGTGGFSDLDGQSVLSNTGVNNVWIIMLISLNFMLYSLVIKNFFSNKTFS